MPQESVRVRVPVTDTHLPQSILDRYRPALDAEQDPLLQELFLAIPTLLDYPAFCRAFARANVRLVKRT